MYIEFDNISDANKVSTYAYKLFTNKQGVSNSLYLTFECIKGKGWLEIPKSKILMKHTRKSDFDNVFSGIASIIDPTFKTKSADIKAQMIDGETYDINSVFTSNCQVRDKDYLYVNGHLIKENEPPI